MELDFKSTVPVAADSNEIDLTFRPRSAHHAVRIVGTVSVGALGRDQYLALAINGDVAGGHYSGKSIDFSPGSHADVVRSINNGLILGYTGWGLDADITFDVVLSTAIGFARSATGSYTTVHKGGRQYISQIGGHWFDLVSAVSSLKLVLPSGGIFNGGFIAVTVAA